MVRNQQLFVNDDDAINQNSMFDLYDCRIDVSKHDVVTGILFFFFLFFFIRLFKYVSFQGTQHGTESDFSFFNKIYDPSPQAREATTSSTDA